MKVTHKVFGNGDATVNGNYVTVIFSNNISKTFVYPDAFDGFLTLVDTSYSSIITDDLNKIKSEAEKEICNIVNKVKPTHIKNVKPKKLPAKKEAESAETLSTDTKINKDLNYINKHTLFEIIGYLCTPYRISCVGAVVPDDDRSVEFEMNFPDQPYTRVELKYDEKGRANKTGSSLTIYFRNIDNCPLSLAPNLVDCFGYAARLNRTRFIYNLVNNYGFKFGRKQDVDTIKNIAKVEGYIEDFNRGYNL